MVSHLSTEIQGLADGRDARHNRLAAADGDLDRTGHRNGLTAGADKGQVSRTLWKSSGKRPVSLGFIQEFV